MAVAAGQPPDAQVEPRAPEQGAEAQFSFFFRQTDRKIFSFLFRSFLRREQDCFSVPALLIALPISFSSLKTKTVFSILFLSNRGPLDAPAVVVRVVPEAVAAVRVVPAVVGAVRVVPEAVAAVRVVPEAVAGWVALAAVVCVTAMRLGCRS